MAIRVGRAPEEPDNVVQPFGQTQMELVAHDRYVDRYGLPENDNFEGHQFVAHDNEDFRAPFNIWMRAAVMSEQITYRGTDIRSNEDAVIAGAGIGFVSSTTFQARNDLTIVTRRRDEWAAPMWLVTHVDLHRTAKVQAFLSFIKERAKDWEV